MAETQSSSVDERSPRQRTAQYEPHPQHEQTPDAGLSDAFPQAMSLLGDARLGERGNAPARAAALGKAQQTHGNRAVQRYLSAQAGAETEEDDIAGRIEGASGGGTALDHSVRGKLEMGLGADMSGVRVHTGTEADTLARSVSSVAFTSGQDIFFREGAFNPHSDEGLKLLAHEATHTVQQSMGPVDGTPSAGGVSISDPSDTFEQAAEQAAERVTSGSGPVAAQRKLLEESTAPTTSVQRFSFGGLGGLGSVVGDTLGQMGGALSGGMGGLVGGGEGLGGMLGGLGGMLGGGGGGGGGGFGDLISDSGIGKPFMPGGDIGGMLGGGGGGIGGMLGGLGGMISDLGIGKPFMPGGDLGGMLGGGGGGIGGLVGGLGGMLGDAGIGQPFMPGGGGAGGLGLIAQGAAEEGSISSGNMW